jgi:hypothetical protein
MGSQEGAHVAYRQRNLVLGILPRVEIHLRVRRPFSQNGIVAPLVRCGHAYAHVSTSRTVRGVLHFPLDSYNKRRLEEIAHAFDLLDRSELRADQDLRKRAGLAAGTSFNTAAGYI